jgi:hypothetical protein
MLFEQPVLIILPITSMDDGYVMILFFSFYLFRSHSAQWLDPKYTQLRLKKLRFSWKISGELLVYVSRKIKKCMKER